MTPFHILRRLALLAVAFLVFDALALEARAGVGEFFSGMSARGRIVQFCVVIAGLSLLIILKKFSPDSRAFAPNANYALSETRRASASMKSGKGMGVTRTTPDSAALHPGLHLDHPSGVPMAQPNLR